MRHGDRGWLIVAAIVVAVEVTAEEGELLSDAADRYNPWATRIVAGLVAAHVANVIPARYDPIHRAFLALRRLSSRRVL